MVPGHRPGRRAGDRGRGRRRHLASGQSVVTLSSQYGNGYFRFVARAHSGDPRWPTYAMAGATFPGTRPSPADVGAQGAWLDDQRQRFDELHRQLLAEGWRPAGHGAHWWSVLYRRPDLDWETPADAYQQTQRSA
jgi:hypothetical protein